MSELRPAAPADRTALLDLWQAAWTAALPQIDFAARRSWMVARLDEFQRSGTLIVTACGADGDPVGFVTVDPGSQVLDQLAVDPSAQGRGHAKSLLDEAKRLSPSGLKLAVNQANERAIRLYRREGFCIVEAGVNERSGLPIWHMRWSGGRAAEAIDR